ncbi:MAG: DUF2815 family protein [Lachnospiraceae bacterium]
MNNDLTNVTTGEVRLSYVHLFKPYAYQPGQEEKFQATILLPKSDVATKARIDAAIEAAKQKGAGGSWNGIIPPVVPLPIYDGDGVRPSDGIAFGPECRGCWVFTASAKADYPPEIVDQRGNPILNQSDIYSGVYGKVNVTFFPYSFGGKKGIGCGLGPVMKTKDGESLGGSAPSAAQAFGVQAGTASGGYVQQPAYTAQPQAAPMQAPGGINPITGQPY